VKEKSLMLPHLGKSAAGYTNIGYPPRDIIPSLRRWSKLSVVYIVAREGGSHKWISNGDAEAQDISAV
jgi:hypothetical protein